MTNSSPRELEQARTLIRKANIAFSGDLDNATHYVQDAERLLKTNADDPSIDFIKIDLLRIKAWIFLLKGNIINAKELARECLRLTEEQKLENNLGLATTYLLLGYIYNSPDKRKKALDYALKSLEINKVLGINAAIADSYSLIARIYEQEGDYGKAFKFCKLSLSIEEIRDRTKLDVFIILANLYYTKSEINQALKYGHQALALSEELNITDHLVRNLFRLGYVYRVIGKINLAIEYFERSLILSEKWGLIQPMALALSLLIGNHIDENSIDIANRYFSRFSDLYNQSKIKGIDISTLYLGAKAYILKNSTRMRDHVEAQAIYKELIEKVSGDALIHALGSLCDLLLEELSIYNDPNILDEIQPLITRSLDIAEKAHNYYWLAETKLLQGKLALIQMNFEEGRRLLIEAQRIADFHGLDLLAWGISTEHDKLLEYSDIWETFPITERIKLAETEQILERIQGKRSVEIPDELEEKSTLLLILAEGGTLVFSYPFLDEWKIDEDLFSSFLSAFNSFSSEFFSKGLDRVKFGDYILLIESIDPFSFCYLFKGQTYLAKQKLTKFIQYLQNNSSIWQTLEKHHKTSQILELKDSPPLKSLIIEIFND